MHRIASLFAAPVLLTLLPGVADGQPLAVSARPATSATLAEGQWQAKWIWGPDRPFGHLGFFRKVIEVGPGLVSAKALMSGDDGYALCINGQKAHNGGFWWHSTNRADFTALLHEGRNVLATRVDNAADPGAWLMELTLVYRGGRTETIATDRTWRFSGTEQAGWMDAGFDEGGWKACGELGSPPNTPPWGDIPHSYDGFRIPANVAARKLPASLKAGDAVVLDATVSLSKRAPGDLGFIARIVRGKEIVAERTWSLSPAASAWKPGAPVRVRIADLRVPRYAPSGEYVVEYGLARTAVEGAVDGMLRATVHVVGREAMGLRADVKVKPHQGEPALFIDGKPSFPMWLFQWRILREDAVAFAKAGFQVYTFDLPMGWSGPGKYDYAEVDRIMIELLDANPNALVVPRVTVGAPAWWVEAHPDQAVRFADGTGWVDNDWGGTKHESFASLEWRKDAGEAMERLVRHMLASPYSDRLIGIHVANGIYGEWHAYSTTNVPDTSEPMREAFAQYVRAKYAGDVERLRTAWGSADVTFDTVSVPTLGDRHSGDDGMFRDPAKSRRVADYYEAYHDVSVDAIDHLCRAVKKASANRLLTCVFYSYSPDLVWPQEGDHRAAPRAHRLASIDIFSSPHSYERRKLGQDGLFRNYPAAEQLHGKLFIDEGDDRTSLAKDPAFTHVKTIDESLEVLRRAFGNAVTHGVGLWYMDQQGTWFHDPRIMAEMAKMKRWADRSMDLPRGSVAQVAVISTLQSEFYIAGRDSKLNRVTGPAYDQQIGELAKSGAAFDWHTIDDLAEGKIPPHRAYVFLDAYYLTDAQRAAIEKLKSGGRALVWLYAAGYVTDQGLSLDAMSRLVGMRVSKLARARLFVDVVGAAPGAKPFGPGAEQSPVFVPEEPGQEVWGSLTDGGQPGLAVAHKGGWTSVFSSTAMVPASLLRRAFAAAGVHIYLDTDDNVSANASWLSIHAASAGRKTVHLPSAGRVYDVLADKLVSANARSFTTDMGFGTTRIYMLTPPERKR